MRGVDVKGLSIDILWGEFLGATIFVVLTIIGLMFVLGFVILFVGIILAIIFHIKRKKSFSTKKSYRVIPIVFLSIGILVLIIPTAITFLIRGSNSDSNIGYVNTGITISYDIPNIDKNSGNYSESSNDYINSFKLNNSSYVMLGIDSFLDFNDMNKLKVVANVKKPNLDTFSSILSFVFNKNNEDTLYAIQNNSNHEILYSTQGLFYCKKEEVNKIIEFYNEMGNYNWSMYDGSYGESTKTEKVIIDSKILNKLKRFSEGNFENKGKYIYPKYIEKNLIGESVDKLNNENFALLKSKGEFYFIIDDSAYDEQNIACIWAIPVDQIFSDYFKTFFSQKK